MPQVIFRYRKGPVVLANIEAIGRAIRPLVAQAASTPEVLFTEDDIDFIPQALEEGALCPNIAIEIRTIGRPERKRKLNEECIRELKERIYCIQGFPSQAIVMADPLIWVQFLDPDGVHI